MKYLCSCMVLVENEHQQIELETWMKKIGRQVKLGKSGPRFLIAEANQGRAQWINLEGQQTREVFARDFINCGTNIELFKALAAMNDDNYLEQWFIANCDILFDKLKGNIKTESNKRFITAGEWYKVLTPYTRNIRIKWMARKVPRFLAKKATIEEITEHFKRSEL